MVFLCLGLSHHTAPIEQRERLNYTPDEVRQVLAAFAGDPTWRGRGAEELAILSTCNRLELYASVSSPDPFAPLLAFLVQTRGVPAADFAPILYRYQDGEAAAHLCRVAAGLDSMILGEPQILGQVAAAYRLAEAQGAAGPVLAALFRAAGRAGKRARAETAIGRHASTISAAAARLAQQVVGALGGRRVLVIGAGKMGELALEALHKRGVGHIAVANRSRERVEGLAARWAGHYYALEQLAEALAEADIVITSTGAAEPVVRADVVRQAMAGRAGRPLVIMDIGVPRDVEPAARHIAGVHLFDMDDLQNSLDGGRVGRRREIPKVEAIVAEEVARLEEELSQLTIQPLITELRQKAETIRQEEVERLLRQLPEMDEQTSAQIHFLSRALVNKLLHEPTTRLRAEAANGRAADVAEMVRDLFGLTTDTKRT